VLFLTSTLSSADKEQARQDGITLVGAHELATLLQEADHARGPEQVIEYFDAFAQRFT
jgi:hypothetical protein